MSKMFGIVKEYKVVALGYTEEEVKEQVKLFMPQYENEDVVEIDEMETGYDNNTYLKGHTPIPPEDKAKQLVRNYRNMLLKASDEYGASDRPQTEDVIKHLSWRQYLRDYTKQDNWWTKNPATFDEWSQE